MPINNNEQVSAEIRNAAKISLGTDSIPRIISGTIVPVIEVGVKSVKTAQVYNTILTNATSANMITTPSDRDFYICSAAISVSKDATSPSTSSSVKAYINGVNTNLVTIQGITLTAQTGNNSIVFPHPVKIDRGTTVTLTATSATAVVTVAGTISYFIDENNG